MLDEVGERGSDFSPSRLRRDYKGRYSYHQSRQRRDNGRKLLNASSNTMTVLK